MEFSQIYKRVKSRFHWKFPPNIPPAITPIITLIGFPHAENKSDCWIPWFLQQIFGQNLKWKHNFNYRCNKNIILSKLVQYVFKYIFKRKLSTKRPFLLIFFRCSFEWFSKKLYTSLHLRDYCSLDQPFFSFFEKEIQKLILHQFNLVSN